MDSNFAKKVYDVVKSIPKGEVATYGMVAILCGHAGASRGVGRVLHNNPSQGEIPCHRVVFADGSLAKSFAFGGEGAQKMLLESEGVCFCGNGKVDMKKCLMKIKFEN